VNESQDLKRFITDLAFRKESMKESLQSGRFYELPKLDKKVNEVIKDFRASSLLNNYAYHKECKLFYLLEVPLFL